MKRQAFLSQQKSEKAKDPPGMSLQFYFLSSFSKKIKLRLKCSIKLSLLMYIILRLINIPGKLNSLWIELTPAM